MHSGFRTLGQQMGMQLVRGILPESIDIFLNDVIVEKVQTELVRGVNTALQDNVNLQPSSMNPTNLFRTLYRNARFKVVDWSHYSEEKKDFVEGNIETDDDGKTTYRHSKLISYYNPINGYYEIDIPTVSVFEDQQSRDNKLDIIKLDTPSEYFINPMMFLSFSIEYDERSRGRAVACRMIGADTIETTLRDHCNGADKSNPIVTLTSIPIINSKNYTEQTSGTSKEYIELHTNEKDVKVRYLNIKYIKAPNIVKFDLDPTNCVNCDLPEYCHFEIVERAVQKYYNSIGQGRTNSNEQRG